MVQREKREKKKERGNEKQRREGIGRVVRKRRRRRERGRRIERCFFVQAEDGIRDLVVTGSDVCSSDLLFFYKPKSFHKDMDVQ